MENLVLPTPEFSLNLPIAGKTVKYRPFLVREEKLMLVLKEAKDTAMVLENLKKIMQRCVLCDTSVADLTYSDFEYLFLNMRVRSIGESIDIEVSCESCGKRTPVEIDLNKICEEMESAKIPTKEIMLTNDIGVIIKPLELKYAGVAASLSEKDQMKMVALFIDKVYTKDQVFTFHEMSGQQQSDFIDSLSLKHMSQIMDKVQEFPNLKTKVKYTCTHCGHESEFVVEGLENFFT